MKKSNVLSFHSSEPRSLIANLSSLMDLIAVIHWLCVSLLALYFAIQILNIGFLLIFIPLFLLGHFFADILSGVVHFMGDTYGSESTPLIGKSFVGPFRLHHAKPEAMCAHSLLDTIGNSSILNIIPHSFFVLALYFKPSSLLAILAIFYTFMASSTILGNLFHKWSHSKTAKKSKLITLLQRLHLILPPEHHNIHHKAPFDTYYCIVNGWANLLLHKLNFWNFSVCLLRIFGIKPDPSSGIE